MIDVDAEFLGYKLDQTSFDIGMAFLIGGVLRIFGFFFLVIMHRDKQK